MVKVEAGSFTMSARDGENFRNEVPHLVTLTRDFYLGRTEVTQAQWKAVMGSNPSKWKGDDLPVEQVSWNDAMAFCDRLNMIGKAPGGWKFTLPTETQWEFAARGGGKSAGYKYCGSNNLNEVGWYYENSGDAFLDEKMLLKNFSNDVREKNLDDNRAQTHPVGKKRANELGLYDMSGNVCEWCLDDWIGDSRMAVAEFSRAGNAGGRKHVHRGGGWKFHARLCRSATRYGVRRRARYSDVGFRLALVPVRLEAKRQPEKRSEPALSETAFSGIVALPGGATLKMVKVEAGSFEMGARDGENKNNEIPHRATLTRNFYIGQTEVTQEQWEAVMDNNPSKWKGGQLPVEQITWNEAMAFCERLNEMGKAPEGWKFTLPTETQWEFAARGGTKSRRYKYSGSNHADKVAWYCKNSRGKTHPVAQKKPNELGLCDMSGNVWEWCLDDYGEDAVEAIPEFTRGNDRKKSRRARRGGSWGFHASSCRPARRDSWGSYGREDRLGFRLALVQVK